MIKNLINRMQWILLVQVLLIGMSILLSNVDCYASTYRKRGRYHASFEISFSDTTCKSKIIKRMCRHYNLHISYDYNHRIKLSDRFKFIQRLCWYTYSFRLKITDMFNKNISISNIKLTKDIQIKRQWTDEEYGR